MSTCSRHPLLLITILFLAACAGNSESAEDVAVQPDLAVRPDVAAAEDTAPEIDATSTPEVATEIDAGPQWPRGCVEELCAANEEHAPDPAVLGPFPVGVTTFTTMTKGFRGQNRILVVDAWYPATEEFRDAPFDWIDLRARAPEWARDSIPDVDIPPIETNYVRDADMRKADGPYPMVIFSHGAYGVRFQSVFFTAYLASHGYVVVAPDHPDNCLFDLFVQGGYSMEEVVNSAFDRPFDIAHLIDLMTQRNEKKYDFFEGVVDLENIGVSGHSFGGYVSFVMALVDSRVKAILPMAPSTQLLPPQGHFVEEITVPVMIMADKLDKTIGEVEQEMEAPYYLVPPPKYYFELLTGGHYTFTDICILDLEKAAHEMGITDAEDALTDGCADFNIPTEIAHPIIRQFGIGFFNRHLRHSPGSADYISADAAAEYEEELRYLLQLE